MSGGSLPPGFRFHPTDEELVGYYLKRKVEGLQIELEVIPVIDLYKFDPWELPDKSFLPKRDMEWFFFCPRDRKYPNGSRTNRATKAGYWKATGKDRKVVCQSSLTGYRKTLVFYQGRAPLGNRTDWVMHEYRLCDDLDHSHGPPSFKGGFALCRIVKRNEPGQKASDFSRETMFKRSGSSSRSGDVTPMSCSNKCTSVSIDMSSQASYMFNESHNSSPVASPDKDTPMAEFDPAPLQSNSASQWISPDLILDSSKEYAKVQEAASEGFSPFEFPSSMDQWHTSQNRDISPCSSYSNFAGEIDYADDFSRFGCMSPYSGNPYYMGYYGNEDIPYEGNDQTGSFHYPNAF